MEDKLANQNHKLEDVSWIPTTLQLPEMIQETVPKDIGKEERDIGSPSDTDTDMEKASNFTPHNDPGNPRNWSFKKKIFHTAIPALYGFVA